MKVYETLTKEQKNEYVKAVKRLNERMRELERHGLEQSPAYRNLQRWVQSMSNEGLAQVDKTGHLRAVQTYKMSPSLMRRTMAVSGNKTATYGGAVRGALSSMTKEELEEIKKTPSRRDELIAERLKFNDELHEFIINHKDAYYGTDLHTATKRPWNEKLTASEAEEFRALMLDPIKAEQENRENVNRWVEEQENKYKR